MTAAFTHASYVATGWVVSLGAIAAFTAATIVRGRRLARQVPDREQRWIDS